MTDRIKAVIADVDGVMVGKAEGVNFPLPHQAVIDALRQLAKSGIPVILCSAKFRTAIDSIITQAELPNPHITDGGALIINPLGEPAVIEQNVIDRATVLEYLSVKEAYTELYTATTCYMETTGDAAFRQKRAVLLQTEPVLVDSLAEVAKTADVIKIISVAENKADMPRIENRVKQLGPKVNYIWSHHPRVVPRRPCIITAPGVTKEHAARKVIDFLGVSLEATLGVGDSLADWGFMKLCGYVGTVGDDQELSQLAESKGAEYYRHASSVDDHGLLAIFKYFGLL